jgi:hypothetical protein
LVAAITFFSASCGHTRAAAPGAPTEVMKTIHDYGAGHIGSPVPENSAKPDESDGVYRTHTNSILLQGDFAQLERMAAANRTNKGRLIGGIWETFAFYEGTGLPAGNNFDDSDYQFQIAIIQKWIKAYPQSAAARISAASIYTNYASFARGNGYANTVIASQWRPFYERTAQAEQLLLEAASLQERDREWYAAMQWIGFNEGWPRNQMEELLHDAVSFEPSYYHFYKQHAWYLRPQWYGQHGDIPAFAAKASSDLSEPQSSILYFQIVSAIACACREISYEVPAISYPRVREGYSNLTRLYGTSDMVANRFAFFACSFKDQASARDAFASITNMEPSVWMRQDIFDESRNWANSQ